MMHGGDVYRNQVLLDFSVNINPMGISKGIEEALHTAVEDCMQYPDLKSEKLLNALETMTGVAQEHILCGSGASELFLAVVHAVRPKQAVIPVPSFWGYEHAARAAGCQIHYVNMRQEDQFCLCVEMLLEKIRELRDSEKSGLPEYMHRNLLFLANPNNPVGNLLLPEQLELILEECRKRNIIVLIDECFMEFTQKEDTYSLKTAIKKYPNLIVIRAFTKLYAIPGVRLGYLFCANERLLEAMKMQLPEWNLSVFAQKAGEAACQEADYRKQTVFYVKEERTYLENELTHAGILVYPAEAVYLLIYTTLPLYERLLEKKILIRDCSNFRGLKRGFYRIAVKSHEENRCLIQAVREILGEK